MLARAVADELGSDLRIGAAATALGVSVDTIRRWEPRGGSSSAAPPRASASYPPPLQGDVTTRVIVGVLLVKSVIWAVSLGSGTSGGVLAPLLMMGGALGAVEGFVLPNGGSGFWPLISMAAMLGGTMRSPFTGVIFGFELTHDVNALLPMLTAVIIAHGFTVLVLRRSILTEKIARHGHHLTRDYTTDPLETHFVRDAMRTEVITLPAAQSLLEIGERLPHGSNRDRQRLYPWSETNSVSLACSPAVVRHAIARARAGTSATPEGIANRRPVVAHPDETLRKVVYRMAESGLTQLPVVERDSARFLGLISLTDLLRPGRTRSTKNDIESGCSAHASGLVCAAHGRTELSALGHESAFSRWRLAWSHGLTMRGRALPAAGVHCPRRRSTVTWATRRRTKERRMKAGREVGHTRGTVHLGVCNFGFSDRRAIRW